MYNAQWRAVCQGHTADTSFSPVNTGFSLKIKVSRYMGIGIWVYRYIDRYIGISTCKFLPEFSRSRH